MERKSILSIAICTFVGLGIAHAQINPNAKKIEDPLPSRHLLATEEIQPSPDKLVFSWPELEQQSAPITVSMGQTPFSRVFLLADDGSTISSGMAARTHFIPNDNRIIVGQGNIALRDSFNPFGTSTFEDALLYGAINSLISRFSKK